MKSTSAHRLQMPTSFPSCFGAASEAEFDIPGHIVADISAPQKPRRNLDGSISVRIEALTIAE